MYKKGKVKEIDISTDIKTYKNNKYEIDAQVADDDLILTSEPESTNESDISEDAKVDLSGVINSLGINMFNKSDEEKAEIKGMLKNFIGALKEKGFANMIVREGDDEDEDFHDPDLFDFDEEREERRMDEGFDNLMKELKENGAPSIKVTENINPRIKKSDLINYLKNKK
jgi:hypothetical protein